MEASRLDPQTLWKKTLLRLRAQGARIGKSHHLRVLVTMLASADTPHR